MIQNYRNGNNKCKLPLQDLTAVQLLWVNLIMDTLGALALATEPPNNGLMNRPLVGRGVNFITKPMWRNIIGRSIYQLAVLELWRKEYFETRRFGFY